jgi:hypothetical protein
MDRMAQGPSGVLIMIIKGYFVVDDGDEIKEPESLWNAFLAFMNGRKGT